MRVGRPSVLDVVGEAPRAAGGRRARRAGRRQLHESLYVALVRGDVRERELLARRDRCVCSASSADPNAGFSYDVASRATLLAGSGYIRRGEDTRRARLLTQPLH